MNAASRAVLILVGCAVAAPLVLFGIYDATAFQPRRTQISAVIDSVPLAEVEVPNLRRLLVVSLNGRTASIAARELIVALPVPSHRLGQLGWHATYALWTGLVALHLSETDQLRVFLATAYLGNDDRGFAAASQRVFGRPLDRLSLSELATLVEISRTPSVALADAERLARGRDRLLAKLQVGT